MAIYRINNKYQEYFAYLDELRESGVTNMFGASPFVAREFGLEKGEARTILADWMQCFSARHGDVNEYVDLAKLGRLDDAMMYVLDRLGTEVKPQENAQ